MGENAAFSLLDVLDGFCSGLGLHLGRACIIFGIFGQVRVARGNQFVIFVVFLVL